MSPSVTTLIIFRYLRVCKATSGQRLQTLQRVKFLMTRWFYNNSLIWVLRLQSLKVKKIMLTDRVLTAGGL